jgi:hypothetical protein
MAEVIAELCFLQVKQDCHCVHTAELQQPDFCVSPEPLDAVDVSFSMHEFAFGMVDAEVALSDVCQSVVSAPVI